uniref:Ig-like domain-containing protein n=1 Tax=Xiphophorus maculatus TaxID=8083 RepID=A0A3B5RAU4_XIPMA
MPVLHEVRCWTIHVPTAVTAVEGSCAVVPCHTQQHVRVIWYKYHNMNYPVVYDQRFNQVEPQFRRRTYVVGKAAEGNCTLKIQDVTMADNNLRVYVWINPDSKATQKFYDQTVIISVEKRDPMISVQSVILEGSIFEVDCSIEHSCPYSPPLIHWYRSQFLQNFTSVTFSSKRGNLWLYRETLRGIATQDMHKTQIRCSAQFRTLTTTSPQISLNVFDPPTILPESSCSLMEDLLRCFCHVEAFPFASISWDIAENDSLISSVSTNYTIRANVVSGEINLPILNQDNVKCKAWNEFGSDTKLLILNITSETSSSLMWLWLMFMGCILILGFTFCIKRKLNMSRPQQSPTIVQPEERYYIPLRLKDSDTNQQTPESNLEENIWSCVYDNDFLEDMTTSMGLQQQQKNAFCDKEHEIEPVSKLIYGKGVYSNIDDDCIEKTHYDTVGSIAVPLLPKHI